jgi:hypothetical protein
MKKIMAALTILMCLTSTNVFAQLKEVRGVQTRMVEYQSNESKGDVGYKRHGFEFKNENSYSVWVEAELCTQGFYIGNGDNVNAGTRDTKNFTLNAGETYVWKCGDRMIWEWKGSNYYDPRDFSDRYFVKYRAYKAE